MRAIVSIRSDRLCLSIPSPSLDSAPIRGQHIVICFRVRSDTTLIWSVETMGATPHIRSVVMIYGDAGTPRYDSMYFEHASRTPLGQCATLCAIQRDLLAALLYISRQTNTTLTLDPLPMTWSDSSPDARRRVYLTDSGVCIS